MALLFCIMHVCKYGKYINFVLCILEFGLIVSATVSSGWWLHIVKEPQQDEVVTIRTGLIKTCMDNTICQTEC